VASAIVAGVRPAGTAGAPEPLPVPAPAVALSAEPVPAVVIEQLQTVRE
jgi:hypothetical protein